MRQNKLELKPSQPVCKARSPPYRVSHRCLPNVGLGLTIKQYTGPKRLDYNKHSSLRGLFIFNREKKFVQH